ncbi:MAG: PAS domain S-box protein, partial [Desulfobacterales bacterium]|nr:PAS domain S-box protein [Desulfobacterales bacterium]
MSGSARAQELQAKGRKLSYIIEHHEDGFYEIDLKGYFVFFNRAIGKISGYTHGELVNINSNALVAPENLPEAKQLFQGVLAKGTVTDYVEINFKKKDGAAIFVKMTAALIKNFKGEPTGFHGFVRDITERRIHEEQQKRAQEQLDTINASLEGAVANANEKAVEAEIANIELNQIFNTSLDGMWILDLKRNVIRVNDTLASMLGMAKAQIE